MADGYLENATVCLDINDNKICDDGEPTDQSDSNGAYTLANTSMADSNDHSIVVQVTTDTIDADTGAVLKPYTLTAPVGKHAFVSPISTMIQTKVEQGLSVENTETVVRNTMFNGKDIDLFANFIEPRDDVTHSEHADYLTIALVAQITAKALQDNQTVIAAAAGESAEDYQGEIINLVVNQVLAQMDEIINLTQNHEYAYFETGELDGMTSLHDTTKVSIGNILEDLNQEANATSGIHDFALLDTLLGDGVFYFENIEPLMIQNVTFKLNDENRYSVTSLDSVFESGAWSTPAPEVDGTDGDGTIVLRENGWELTKNLTDSATVIDNRIISDGEWREETWAVRFDIAGKSVKNHLREAVINVSDGDETAVFSEGAQAFKFSWSALHDSYRIQINTYNDCNYNDVTLAVELVASCSNVNDATSFNDIIMLESQSWYPDYKVTLEAETNGATSGTAIFVVGDKYQVEGESQVLVKTTWQLVTVQGYDMIKYEYPTSGDSPYSRRVDEGETHGFYVNINDGIYEGRFTPKGALGGEGFYDFNKIAIEDIKNTLIL